MIDEFEMETEVRDLRHAAAPGRAEEPKLGEVADETSHLDGESKVADGGKPGNVGQGVSLHKEPLPSEVVDAPCAWAPEMEWLFGLMPDKHLIRLRDVVKFRQDKEEYYRNPACHISCATMEYIMRRIDEELKWRREKGLKVE